MKKMSAAAAMLMVLAMSSAAYAAHDENLNNYTLDNMVVEDNAVTNKFGDTITEQSYYRTGGDVKVITREEIEKRHYTDVTEAIKRIPGVTFQNPGYRGGEYGYQFYNNGVSINGDTRVVVLVDGRRVDNAASERIASNSKSGSKSTGVNIDQEVNMENVEKIEVIKGPGASQYGADATGGVINIITRKGGKDGKGSIDLSTGSWHKHKYSMNYSGTADKEQTLHYFVSVNRDMSGDTKYHDGIVGGNGTLGGSKWKEDGANIRIDKELNDKQSIKFWYNYKQGKDGYPIAVPNLKYYNEKDWNDIIFKATVGELKDMGGGLFTVGNRLSGDANNPGYHNLYALDGKVYGSFSKFKNNDMDIQFTFDKDNGMESYIRAYSQHRKYSNRDKYVWGVKDDGSTTSNLSTAFKDAFPSGATAEQIAEWSKTHLAPFPGGAADRVKEWLEKTGGTAQEPTSWREEDKRGVEFQYAKSVGVNDIIANVSYAKNKMYSKRIGTDGSVTSSDYQRSTTSAYLQDKIHISDKWDLTPSVRYVKYGAYSGKGTEPTVDRYGNPVDNGQGKGSSHLITPSINTQYMFDDSASMYLGWTKVYRPVRRGDYTSVDGVFKTPLEDEKGDVMVLGLRKDLSDKTSVAVHYDWTRMSNAIATLPILMDDGVKSTAVNAKEDKKSFNITADHKFDEHFNMSASYSHMKNEWKAKSGWVLDPSWGYASASDINTAINSLRAKNHYALNASYENKKLYTGLLINWYTGCSQYAFTNNQFLVLDWNLNYKVSKNLTAYVVCSNLTNEAYETSYNSWNGVGSSAMPGRCWMVGLKYNF